MILKHLFVNFRMCTEFEVYLFLGVCVIIVRCGEEFARVLPVWRLLEIERQFTTVAFFLACIIGMATECRI